MSDFSQCHECGHKLGHVTVFCARCGRPSCCLDCHLRHTSRHARGGEGEQRRPQGHRQLAGPRA
jgi:hypothetical protein